MTNCGYNSHVNNSSWVWLCYKVGRNCVYALTGTVTQNDLHCYTECCMLFHAFRHNNGVQMPLEYAYRLRSNKIAIYIQKDYAWICRMTTTSREHFLKIHVICLIHDQACMIRSRLAYMAHCYWKLKLPYLCYLCIIICSHYSLIVPMSNLSLIDPDANELK